MRHTEIIKAIMRKTGVTQQELAFRLGLSGPSVVSNRISRRHGTIMNTAEMLDAMDYEMVIRPATKGELAPGEYLLCSRDYEEEP